MKHFDAIKSSKNSEVIGIFDFDIKKSIALKKKYPYLKIYKNENEIFNDDKINLVSIASYDEHHFRQISKSFKVGKNFIIEKPICTSRSEFRKVKKLIKKNKNVKFISNLPLRTEPIFKFFKKKITQHNKIYYIEADYLWGRSKKLFHWKSSKKEGFDEIVERWLYSIQENLDRDLEIYNTRSQLEEKIGPFKVLE